MDTVHDVTEAVLGLEIHFGLPSGLQGSSSFRHRPPGARPPLGAGGAPALLAGSAGRK